MEKKSDLDIHNGSVQSSLADSNAVVISFYYMNITRGYIYYNMQTPEDSVEIRWVKKNGKCCDKPVEYLVIDSVKFNNTLVNPVNGVLTFVK
ncbi:MAG: hypothetical protein IPP72_02020 [Chitinophagaceae bacterium]|nr:hypothetical protein [Chitinophagaceae bacterium]